MKRFFLLLACSPLALFAQDQPSKGFVVTGKVNGIADGKVQIVTMSEEHTPVATDSVKNGVFTLKGVINEPGLYFLVLANEQPQYLYLENNVINITGSKSDLKNLKVIHKDFWAFLDVLYPKMGLSPLHPRASMSLSEL